MATTAQLIAYARSKLLEEEATLIDDAKLLAYANFAYEDLQRRAFPNSAIKSATVTFVAGLSTNLPADFGTLYTEGQRDAYNIFPEVSLADFLRNTGENAITVDGAFLRISPNTTTSLNIRYYPKFAALALLPVQDPQIDSFLHELIIYGILWRALEDLQDEELSKYYRTKFEDELKIKVEALSNYEEYNQSGGQMFNPIQIISE